jgi:glyceraldehyde-3-phosphate dehydrogenase/erythrose-4-phosphate dehydrogenase
VTVSWHVAAPHLYSFEALNQNDVLGVTMALLVSSDIIKDPRASVVYLDMTQGVDGDLVKLMSWYDNEWGYSSRLVREALRIARDMDRKRSS